MLFGTPNDELQSSVMQSSDNGRTPLPTRRKPRFAG